MTPLLRLDPVAGDRQLTAFIGTTSGVSRLGDDALEPLGLDGHNVTALHAAGALLLAGTYGDGLFRSTDRGRSWERIETGLTASTFRFVTAELAGTEPARVFRSSDDGRSWAELEGITGIPGHEQWFLPYSPRAGAARNAHVSGERWLVAAEVAGIARSRDGSRTWEKVETDYTRATIVPPARPDLVLAGPAPRVGRGGRIVLSRDGGDTWEPAGNGIDVPMPDMVELFVAAPDGTVWAICSGGRLLRAAPDDWSWTSALPADAAVSVKSVAFPA